MAIPENQLETWSHQGAQAGSQNTYNSIKSALSRHNWPSGMNHSVYLQGSYPNATNIYGDSDVDVVVESSNVFYNDLPANLKQQMGWIQGHYSWTDFRDEVKKALAAYYSASLVSQGDKCIKVKGDGSSRLNADVVPCCTYRHYRGSTHAASGITFWTKTHIQVVNYPKLHLSNGHAKNTTCSTCYKRNLRVFKNARNKSQLFGKYPSYFLECLFYNVPSNQYGYSHSSTYENCLGWLQMAAQSGNLSRFYCQNGVQLMFGTGIHQSNVSDAKRLINDLIVLWNKWGG